MRILAAWRRPRQNKRACGKTGEKESGFARSPRCRPGNLIWHDQPKSRRSRIEHEATNFTVWNRKGCTAAHRHSGWWCGHGPKSIDRTAISKTRSDAVSQNPVSRGRERGERGRRWSSPAESARGEIPPKGSHAAAK